MRNGQKTIVAKRLRKSLTLAETVLWSRLKGEALGFKFRRQHPVGPYIVDFACVEARLVVEVDGATHRTPEQLAYDERRTTFLEAESWRVLRVQNQEVLKLTSGVIEAIHIALHEQQGFLADKRQPR